jgi:GTP cyclohydrolase III
MDFEHQLRNGLTVEKLEEIINSSDKREQLDNELASEFHRKNLEARQRWFDELRDRAETQRELQEELHQKLEEEKEEQAMLATAGPELINAVANIKLLEAQLAEKEWENKRLTALVSELEHKLRNVTKFK